MALCSAKLPHRTAIEVGGPDRYTFLQNILSNNIHRAIDNEAVYAALLSPQGKFLHDVFVWDHAGSFLIDCETGRSQDLLNRLMAYKLRSKVVLQDASDAYDIWAAWGDESEVEGFYRDPRLRELGHRGFIPKTGSAPPSEVVGLEAYDAHRMILGIADGSNDMEIEKSTLEDFNFSYLHGVDWEKGCYVGQELTARMHYRRLGKRRLFPVRFSASFQSSEKDVFFRGDLAGHLCSHNQEVGLALLSSEAVNLSIAQKVPLNCGTYGVTPTYPDWLIID